MFQESYLDPCSTLENQTWSNDQSQHHLLYGGVSLSTSLRWPVPVYMRVGYVFDLRFSE